MSVHEAFTYPFCYVPSPEVKAEAERLISAVRSNPSLRALFSEGKMMGVLMTSDAAGNIVWLHGFSGLAGGMSIVDGFVPPIFDYTAPDGYFRRTEAEISMLNRAIECSEGDTSEMRERRRSMSAGLQDWLFSQYVVSNAKGESMSIKDIFALRGLVPPGGTGECATPKLLQFAYSNNLKPLAMGEFWYGAPPRREIRREGAFYPSCTGKCGPLLEFMLQGLELEPNPLDSDAQWDYGEPSIIYSDDSIIAVDKPSGMLCVPGRNNRQSLQEWLSLKTGAEVFSCHRLDMDTSGLVIFARDAATQAGMQRLFAEGCVRKMYKARLMGGPFEKAASGYIRLPLMLDYYDRPRRIVDWENGKMAVTRYEVERILPDGSIDVRFFPCTGRTHQLRVHAAHPLGLGHPIKGDRLYGGGAGRLCLRAVSIEFSHPVTGETLSLSCDQIP